MRYSGTSKVECTLVTETQTACDFDKMKSLLLHSSCPSPGLGGIPRPLTTLAAAGPPAASPGHLYSPRRCCTHHTCLTGTGKRGRMRHVCPSVRLSVYPAETAPKAAHFLREHAQGCEGGGSAEPNLDHLTRGQPGHQSRAGVRRDV